jgi:hypothetical protein
MEEGRPAYRGDRTHIKEVVMKMKYEDMGDRPFVMAPVIDERLEQVPINPIGVFVYGYLVFLAKRDNDTSRTKVATTLRLDKKAVDRAVAVLVEGGAVVEDGCRIKAVDPQGASCEWFRRIKNPTSGEWYEQFVYDRVFLPRSSSVLSVRANLLFWHLVRLGQAVDSMPGYHKVGGSSNHPPKYLTVEYLAQGLRCYRKTIKSSLTRLRELDLVRIQFTGKRRFVIGLPPIGTRAELWRDSWKASGKEKAVAEVTAESLFGVPSHDILRPSTRYDAGAGLYIRSFGIKGRVSEEIVTKIVKHRILPAVWQPMLTVAKRDHEENCEKNPGQYRVDHCGHLFKHMLAEYLKKEQIRRLVHDSRPNTGYSEAKADSLIQSLRMTSRAGFLLRQAIKVEQFDLRGGGAVPCRLHWQDVVLILEKAGKDFDAFKKGVAEFIFDLSRGVPACDWLEEWMSLKPIPAFDETPLEPFKLDSKARGLIRSHAKMIAERKVGNEDPVACGHLINDLIRLGSCQATNRSKTGLEAAIDDISQVLFTRSTSNKRPDEEFIGQETEAERWRRKLEGVRVF